jgi:hypothetical protein
MEARLSPQLAHSPGSNCWTHCSIICNSGKRAEMAKDLLTGWALTKDATLKLVQQASQVRLVSDSASHGSLACTARRYATFHCPADVFIVHGHHQRLASCHQQQVIQSSNVTNTYDNNVAYRSLKIILL